MAAVVSRTELVEDPAVDRQAGCGRRQACAEVDAAVRAQAHRAHRLVGHAVRPGWHAGAGTSAPKIVMSRSSRRMPDWRASGRSCTLRTARLWIKSLTHLPKPSARQIRGPSSNVGRTRWALWPPDCRPCVANAGRRSVSAAQRRPATDVVIHVLAEQATISGDSQVTWLLTRISGRCHQSPCVTWQQPRRSSRWSSPRPVRNAVIGLRRRWPNSCACRDLTCRFPGCDEPAEVCDIDHTVPFPLGPTHPSNLKLLCRYHHLLKTFYTGFDGWADRQLPDGTVEWTAPSGHTYATTPGGSDLFPDVGHVNG